MQFDQKIRNMLTIIKHTLNRSLWLNIWWCLPTNSETETNIDEKKIKAVVHLYCNWNGTSSIIGWLLSLVNQKLATPNAPLQDISCESYRCLHKISLIIDGCHIKFETGCVYISWHTRFHRIILEFKIVLCHLKQSICK